MDAKRRRPGQSRPTDEEARKLYADIAPIEEVLCVICLLPTPWRPLRSVICDACLFKKHARDLVVRGGLRERRLALGMCVRCGKRSRSYNERRDEYERTCYLCREKHRLYEREQKRKALIGKDDV